jgi:YidC/Oxa1 family membrane protein insertase
MNKNSVIGFLLIGAIFVTWMFWMTPSKEEIAKQKHVQDSLAMVQQAQDSLNKIKTAAGQKSQQQAVTPKATNNNAVEQKAKKPATTGVFSFNANGKEQYYTLETDLAKFKISKKGGFISSVELKKYKTWDKKPLYLFDSTTSNFGISFFSDNQLVNTSNLYFEPVLSGTNKTHFDVNGKNTLTFRMRLYARPKNERGPDPSYIEYDYTFTGNNYMLGFKINLHHMQGIIPDNMNYVDLKWYADMLKEEKNIDRFSGSTVYYKYLHESVEHLAEKKDEKKEITTKVRWVSFKQRFFTSTLIADNYFNDGVVDVRNEKKEETGIKDYLKTMSANVTIPFSVMDPKPIGLRFYFGPNKFYTLKSYGLKLERQIPIGWGFFLLAWINEYIIIPVFDWLGGFGWNYGIVILVLTILLKLVLFPIASKTYKSSAKMRVLKPEVDAINAKFPKKEDSMKKQQAVMALYKKAGANPASGCIPMLLQMPILFAMFEFFPSAIQLRQQSFLWAHDLSTYDSILHLPWNIPMYGDHVSLFTLLMTISTVMYTYLNNQMMGSQTQGMPGMKTMMYIMPIMFMGIFNDYASGLSYYYFLANIITFLQMYIFQKSINEDKVRKQIEMNKKKPKKKSAFQKRLEEAQKQARR